MYYPSYEDYMRQVLGYSPNDPNIYEKYGYTPNNYEQYYHPNLNRDTYYDRSYQEDVENWYPEIYNTVYPLVCNVCDNNTKPITKQVVEQMTDEVYNLIDNSNNVVNVSIEVPLDEKNKNRKLQEETNDRRTYKNSGNSSMDRRETNLQKERVATQKEDRIEPRRTNSLLRDLVKILLLQRIFGRPNRPPFPGNPGRPPFPSTPGRPPFYGMPRTRSWKTTYNAKAR